MIAFVGHKNLRNEMLWNRLREKQMDLQSFRWALKMLQKNVHHLGLIVNYYYSIIFALI